MGEIVFLSVFWAWVWCAVVLLRKTIVPKGHEDGTPDVYGLIGDTVSIRSTDGVQVQGWRLPGADPEHPWILLCRGVSTKLRTLLGVARALQASGFNLLVVQLRGRGGQSGRTTSFGWREQRDVEGALAFLGQQPGVPASPYGIYGLSVGASAALMVAARDERIGAVVADSPYPNLRDALRGQVARLSPWIPKTLCLWGMEATYRMRFGVWPRRVAPQDRIGSLSPRPLLLIQGAKDSQTPLGGAERLLASAGHPKDLWVLKEAGHDGAYAHDPETYVNRVRQFFETHMRPRPGTPADLSPLAPNLAAGVAEGSAEGREPIGRPRPGTQRSEGYQGRAEYRSHWTSGRS